MTLGYELHKVKQEIQWHGSEYDVYRMDVDKYQQTRGQFQLVNKLSGLFHIVRGYRTRTTNDATHTNSIGQPMLLVLYEDSIDICENDVIIIGEEQYKVLSKDNKCDMDIVSDISLELIQNGYDI